MLLDSNEQPLHQIQNNVRQKMKSPGLFVILVLLSGCASKVSMLPPAAKDLASEQIPEFKPDLSAFKKAVQMIDRVRVVAYAPTDTHPKATVTKPQLVARFKLLLGDAGITPSFTPAAEYLGPLATGAGRGSLKR
jgi:hypothetical protein